MSRCWFFNIPYHGHVNPTLPLIRELVDRGDEVTYFSTPNFEKRICATGAAFRSYTDASAFDETRDDTHTVHQGALLAKATNHLLRDVLADVERERPDYVLFDMSAPWGSIAGRRYNLPAVASFPHLPFYWRTVLDDRRVFRKFMASVSPGSGHYRTLQRQIRSTARAHGLRNPRDVNVLSSSAELNIVFLTRYFQPYQSHFDESYVYVGPTIETDRREEPMQISKLPGQRLIYIAVGTVYKSNLEFFRICAQALGDPRYAVILSVGRAVELDSLGPMPKNFTVAQYVPQLQVLQEADLFVTHAGMNSVNEAVTYGVPMVLVPNTIEQTINASRIEQLSCGIYLDHKQLTAKSLEEAVSKVLSDPAASRGLGRLQESFREAGGTQLAADSVDRLKAKHGLS
ncbi:MAG: macrolide family glycosyltransferase [Caldilineaceae bacterium]